MRLRDQLGLSSPQSDNRAETIYRKYGVLDNPFPSANQTTGNPHHPTEADDAINARLKSFFQTGNSEVIVVTGSQGLGKTNLLEYYNREIPSVATDYGTYFVIRYQADPDPDFGVVVRRIFQELGTDFIKKAAKAANALPGKERDAALSLVRGREMQDALLALIGFAKNEDKLVESSKLMLDYLMGQRIYKRHTEVLDIQFKLDTVGVKTQALHDMVYFGQAVKCLDGVFLFLDELEKMYGVSPQAATRYLSAIRALLDALPQHLFLVCAMTPDARVRYINMLPALGGRLRDAVNLRPLAESEEALDLFHFYLRAKREEAKMDTVTKHWEQGDEFPLNDSDVDSQFAQLLVSAQRLGVKGGVTQRQFLDKLHDLTSREFMDLPSY